MLEWAERLQKLDQGHLLKECEADAQDQIIKQLERADNNYPGGLEAYLENARKLLTASKNNEDSFKGYSPLKPPTYEVPLTSISDLLDLEQFARDVLHQVGFVLVAGGLGERLGYPDIKVKLFTQVTCEMTYLEYYCKSILKCQKSTGIPNVKLPFFIMTSGDTHERTVDFLKESNYFGLDADQVYIRQQEKVPALRDSAGHIALSSDKRAIETKPHGHGDVHMILYQQKLLDTFREKYGTEWLFFFQDTNALAFRVMHALIGVSVKENLTMNSLAIPRLAGEAVGAICHLKPESPDRKEMVLNVEYNQLDSLLKSSGLTGDIPIDTGTGLSQYPGNCNILVFKMAEYFKVLNASGGMIPEFINPKYADASRDTFKSPTRIECMMQEIPRMFSDDQKHGCTVASRWFCFSTIKNCCADASTKVTPECAFSAEQDLYANSRKCLELVLGAENVSHEAPIGTSHNGVIYPQECRVWISPEVAVSVMDLKEILNQSHCTKIELRHDAAYLIKPDTCCKLVPLPQFKSLTEQDLADPDVPSNYKVRGYMPITTV